MYLIPGHVTCELNLQRRIAEARRDSAARSVGLANGSIRSVFRRLGRRTRTVVGNEFLHPREDVWKGLRF